jgi:hypothetical protein
MSVIYYSDVEWRKKDWWDRVEEKSRPTLEEWHKRWREEAERIEEEKYKKLFHPSDKLRTIPGELS